jgi:hypothetical protein
VTLETECHWAKPNVALLPDTGVVSR